jgi:hypothetical protein
MLTSLSLSYILKLCKINLQIISYRELSWLKNITGTLPKFYWKVSIGSSTTVSSIYRGKIYEWCGFCSFPILSNLTYLMELIHLLKICISYSCSFLIIDKICLALPNFLPIEIILVNYITFVLGTKYISYSVRNLVNVQLSQQRVLPDKMYI